MSRPPKDVCFRGHEISGENLKIKNRGKGCRACECALSQAHNTMHRHGKIWGSEELQAYADMKFEEFRGNRL